MKLQHWRNRLVEQLRRQGLPSRQVDRLVEELTEHALDLLSENHSMDAAQNLESRLGTPEQLASVAKEQFKRSTFAGRHPLLTFVAGPFVTMIGTLVCAILVICLVTWGVSLISGPESVQNPIASLDDAIIAYRICECVSLFFRFVPFVFSVWIFVRLGNRIGKRSWSFVACGVVALIAFCFRSGATLETQPDNRVFINVDWFSIPNVYWFNPAQITQAVVPLAFGALLYWQSLRSRPNKLSVQ